MTGTQNLREGHGERIKETRANLERNNKREGIKTEETKDPLEVIKAHTTASNEESAVDRNND